MKDLRNIVPFLGIATLFSTVAVLSAARANVLESEQVWNKVSIACISLCFYAWKVLYPVNLAPLYPFRDPQLVPSPYYGGCLALVGSAFLGAWLLRGRMSRGPIVAVLLFVLLLLPTLGFVSFVSKEMPLVADRYQYLASAALIALLVAILGANFPRLTGLHAIMARPAASLVLISLAVLTWRQSCVYENEETFWRYTISKNTRAWLAYNNLGRALIQKGNLDEALRCYRTVQTLRPESAFPYYNAGCVLAMQGRIEGAISELREAIRIEPQDAMARQKLEGLLRLSGKGSSDTVENASASPGWTRPVRH